MAREQDSRRVHPRRPLSNVEMFCYRASPSLTPQLRRNIGREIVDISQGGAQVRVTESVPKGETITLELRDRGSGESFRARGQVRWSLAAGASHVVGVQFSEHYTPMGLREQFTTGQTPPPVNRAPDGEEDIVLAPVEKRKANRFTVDDYVATVFRQGTLAAQGLKRNLARQILDLSPLGAQALVTESLEPGSLIQFTLHFNTLSDTLDALAAVRWCRPDGGKGASSYRLGLQFLNLSDSQRRMVEFMRKWFDKRRKK